MYFKVYFFDVVQVPTVDQVLFLTFTFVLVNIYWT